MMNRKELWETSGRRAKRRLARCLLPAFLCAHIFIERETSGYEPVVTAIHRITLYPLTVAQLVSLILIHWIVIYLVNYTIQPLNNWSLIMSLAMKPLAYGLRFKHFDVRNHQILFQHAGNTTERLRLNQSKYTADDDIDSVGN